jgi:L-lactate permease
MPCAAIPPIIAAPIEAGSGPVIAVVLPFYVIALYGGWRSIRALWPVLLVAGGSFAITQFAAPNLTPCARRGLQPLKGLGGGRIDCRLWPLVFRLHGDRRRILRPAAAARTKNPNSVIRTKGFREGGISDHA